MWPHISRVFTARGNKKCLLILVELQSSSPTGRTVPISVFSDAAGGHISDALHTPTLVEILT